MEKQQESEGLYEKILELKADRRFCAVKGLGIYVDRFIDLLEKFAKELKHSNLYKEKINKKIGYKDYIKARRRFFQLRGNLETMFKRQYMLMAELKVSEINGNEKEIEKIDQLQRELKNRFAKIFLDTLTCQPEKISWLSFIFSSSKRKQAFDLIRLVQELEALVHWLGKIQHQEIENLKIAAAIDSLTGLPNKKFMLDFLVRETERAKHIRKKQKKYLTLFFVEVDDFKRFNTEYGHLNGDLVLQLIAKYLRNGTRMTRDVDVVGRFGGDEFMIVMHNLKIKDSEKIAERLRKHVSENVTREFLSLMKNNLDNKNLENFKITISIGISAFLYDAKTLQQLIEHADKAMQYAKNVLGKNAWCRYKKSLEKKLEKTYLTKK